MSNLPALEAVKKATIQTLPDAEKGGGVGWLTETARGPVLPPWGTRERERALRAWYRHEYNTLVQGAFAGLAKRWAAASALYSPTVSCRPARRR